jgi:hypothetical protein
MATSQSPLAGALIARTMSPNTERWLDWFGDVFSAVLDAVDFGFAASDSSLVPHLVRDEGGGKPRPDQAGN